MEETAAWWRTWQAHLSWEDGILGGIKATSGEFIVDTARGIWRTRTISKRPEQEQWSASNLQLVGGVPLRLSDQDPKIDGEAMVVDVPPSVTAEMKDAPATHLLAPNNFYVRKHDLEAYGYTQGCPGCRSVLRGGTRQGHNESSRQRILRDLKGSERVKRYDERLDDFLAKTLEREDKKRKHADETIERQSSSSLGNEGGQLDVAQQQPLVEPQARRGQKRISWAEELEHEEQREQKRRAIDAVDGVVYDDL